MIDELVVRVAERRDLADLDALFGRAYPRSLKADYPPSIMVTALPLISKAQPSLVTCGTFFVAENESGIVAAGGWTPRRDSRMGDVRHVVTDDQHQRQGIGRAVFDRIFTTARDANVTLLDCKATRTAVPFYKALGFKTLGPLTVDLRPGISFPAVQMQRWL
ncbi:MAG: GNAT family N-acetyltransferase [Pseudomonadota bacterium]